jgi:hypothetical protein
MNMRKTASCGLALLLIGASPSGALAQSTPGFYYGQVPTPAQWNAAFAAKQDYLGFTPVNRAGDVMQGFLGTIASSTATAGFNLPPGVAPTSPNNGDLWMTNAGLFAFVSGATIGPFAAANSNVFAATPPIAVSFPGNVVTYGLNIDSNFAVVSHDLALASAPAYNLLGNCGASSAEPVPCPPANALTALGNGTAASGSGAVLLAHAPSFTATTGTAPFSVASTTQVANLNSSQLEGGTWEVPGAIGSTTANSGAFTALSASGTVSGAGFSTYLASPPAIGGTLPNTGKFSTLTDTGLAVAGLVTNTSAGLFGTTPLGSGVQTALGLPTNSTGGFPTINGSLTSGNCLKWSLTGIQDGGSTCGVSAANPSATIGLTAVNGTASTFMRSDAAPAISQAISPTWTGNHTFQNTIVANTGIAVGLPALENTGPLLPFTTLQLASTNSPAQYGSQSLLTFTNDASTSFLNFSKSRGTTLGAQAAVQVGDDIGEVDFAGSDGTNWVEGGYFTATIDSAVSAGVMPTKFEWGSRNPSGTLNEHMRLGSSSVLTVGDSINNTYNQIKLNPETAGTDALISIANSSQTNVGLTFNIQGTHNYTFSHGTGFTSDFVIVPASQTIQVPSFTAGYVCSGSTGLFSSASTCSSSDARLKNVEGPLTDGLHAISKLKPVKFHWKDPKRGTGEQIGLIAQDVEKVFPQIVGKNSDGYKTLDYEKLVAPMIVAIKELKAKSDNLERCQSRFMCRLFGWK